MPPTSTLPAWAPRVAQAPIRRLYELDAQGIVDDELIDTVAYALLARCESFIAATDAAEGRVHCPRCAAIVPRADLLRCPCGWALPWTDYFDTIQHRQLSGALPVREQFAAYVHDLPLAHGPREKMLLIDRLIHGFHYYYKDNAPTRPVAVNLIEGRMSEVVAFLDGLSAGAGSTPEMRENRAAWEANLAVHADWYAAMREPTPNPPSPARHGNSAAPKECPRKRGPA